MGDVSFAALFVLAGLLLTVLAKPIADATGREANEKAGIPTEFRVWSMRVVGILMSCVGVVSLIQHVS